MLRIKQRFKYVFFDLLASEITWILFYSYRKFYIEPVSIGHKVPFTIDKVFFIALLIIPIFWLFLHLISGYYRYVYRKSRLLEFGQTFFITFIGTIIIFFFLLLDDWVSLYTQYYSMFLVLFTLQFSFTYIFRLVITTISTKKIRTKKIVFNSLIIGDSQNALDIYKEVENQDVSHGLNIVGYLYMEKNKKSILKDHLECLGGIDDIDKIIEKYNIEEVIIALESKDHSKIKGLLNILAGSKVSVNVIPDMYDILIGKVRISSVYGFPLIEISKNIMPAWQEYFKRILDVILSTLAIIILFPIYIAIAIAVKLSSPGPIIYSHYRIGKDGVPFRIYKFRSMYKDSEKNGPALSSKLDSRVTNVGRFLRKTRLDEIPQFFNVLKGEMSLVGPRPERQFFIDQIVEKAPHYKHLLSVKPGITSWGQVKYGYAENVDQMIERLKYDIIYIESRSLYEDFKIMILTIKIVFQRKGI